MRSSQRVAFAALLSALVMTVSALAGCSASSDPSQGESRFRIAYYTAPASLDPAQDTVTSALWPAYEPLIYLANDGSLEPALATSWGYLDDTNTAFEMTIREGVTFSDGDPLTAEAVQASLQRFLDVGSSWAVYAGPVESVEVTGDETVVIHYREAFPSAAVSLTQDYLFGLIVSPTGVADPDSLGMESHGTGQYVLDSGASVTGSSYVFQANEDYWNPDAVKFDAVEIVIAPDASSQLAMLTSGQADAIWNTNAETVANANVDDSDLQYASAGGNVSGLMLENRASGPLSDPRVREAISLAIDRQALAAATSDGLAQPDSSVLGPDQVGAEPLTIERDLDRSRELLTEAGYPDGVSFSLLATEAVDPNYTIVSAIQSQLAEAGITVELVTTGLDFAAFMDPLFAMAEDAAWFGLGFGFDSYIQLTTFAYGGLANVLGESDAQLDDLLAQAAVATGDEYDELMTQAVQRFDSLNWVVPVFLDPPHYLVNADVEGVPGSSVQQQLSAFSPNADDSWQFAG